MSKYIIELDENAKKVVAISLEDGIMWTDETEVENLEELNSDYINEHFRELQETAYKKGLHDGESKCGYCNEYQRGLDDAWEAARKIADMWTRIDNDELLAIFGFTERIGHSVIKSLFGKQTANEAMLELEAYEEKQKAEELKVGDVVTIKSSDKHSFVVTKVSDETVWGVDANGSWNYWDINEVTKTDKHFDIDKILGAMRE